MKEDLVPPEVLISLIEYDSKAGALFWKVRTTNTFCGKVKKNQQECDKWNYMNAGRRVGSVDRRGYRNVYVSGYCFREHRVAWAIYYGSWPNGQIDHINGVRDDNRISNLRCVTSHENSRNQKRKTTNRSGVTGVRRSRTRGRWIAEIWHNWKPIHLGTFDSIDDAIKARKNAEKMYNFHKNHGR